MPKKRERRLQACYMQYSQKSISIAMHCFAVLSRDSRTLNWSMAAKECLHTGMNENFQVRRQRLTRKVNKKVIIVFNICLQVPLYQCLPEF